MAKETLQEKLRGIINKHDPIGLIKLGCPLDEYNPEIKLILEQVPKCSSAVEASNTIHSIFVKMFEYGSRPGKTEKKHVDKGGAGKPEDYRKIAEEIYPLFKPAQT